MRVAQNLLHPPMIMLVLGLMVSNSALAQVVDQAHIEVPNVGYSIRNSGPIGQSFTPTLSSLNWVELSIKDYERSGDPESTGATFIVVLHSGSTLAGPEIGRSDPVFLPSGFGRSPAFDGAVVRFTFPTAVPLVPNTIQTFELSEASGDALGYFLAYGTYPSSYNRGDAVGPPIPNLDFWFREGLSAPIMVAAPIPTLTAWMFGLLIAVIGLHATLIGLRKST